MKLQRILLILPAAALTAWAAFELSTAWADTVYLKNGRKIEGKVTDNRTSTGLVIVEVGEVGRVTLKAGQVDKIETAKPQSDVKEERVSVTVGRGNDYYGTKSIEGRVSPESDDKKLILSVPGGKMEIPRSGVAKTTKIEDEPMPAKSAADPALPARTIKTTHLIELTNGRKLQGNLVKTADWEPVRIQLGPMGTMSIPRNRIAADGIKESEGTITLPEEKKAPAAPQVKPPTPEEMKAQLKMELKDELIREVLDQLLEEKLEKAVEAQKPRTVSIDEQSALSNDQILAIQDSVRDLSRQRSQNRVRGERHLIDMGVAVLPYLEPVAGHPFDLTRRAVQRIVREIGDWRGASISIEALNDSDEWVRDLAHEALKSLLPSSIAYAPKDSERSRLAAQDEYRALWDETVRAATRDSLLRKIALSVK